MKPMLNRERGLPYFLAMLALGLGATGLFLIYQIPSVNERLYWRVEVLKANILELISPRPDYVPAPEAVYDPEVVITMAEEAPSLSLTTHTSEVEVASAEPIPDRVFLAGTEHQWQHWNNCGPATLAMTLNFWGWPGTQANTAAVLKPNRSDRNVSPHEMVASTKQAGYGALTRVSGTPDLIRRLVAAGLPVIIERELWLEEDGWAGHYALIIGYDQAVDTYVTQDTFQGPELVISETRLNEIWFPFNYRYVVVFPPDREEDVLAILGPAADPLTAHSQAAQRALEEIESQTGVRQAMAYFNLGLSIQELGDSATAVAAFDQARLLDIPYRMLWYQPDIYAAYFAEELYSEVIKLANFSINSNSYSEEAYYWRGQAHEALGDQSQAISDYQTSVELNPNYSPPANALAALGVLP